MRLSSVLASEAMRSGGAMKIRKVPRHKQPKASVNKKIEKEIRIQVTANEAMSNRSLRYASRSSW